MAHYIAVVRGKTGKIVPGANVSVFETGTATLADLFSDEPLTTSIDNPTQADDCGRVDFYIASGEYDILIQRFDIEDTRFDDVSILEDAPTGFSPKYLTARLSATQTANLTAGNHVEFDTKSADSGHITLSTGTGQANGIFTIPAGVWVLSVGVLAEFNLATGVIGFRFEDDDAGTVIDHNFAVSVRPYDSADQVGSMSTISVILVNSVSVNAKVAIVASTAVTQLNPNQSGITIFGLS